ncbi:hypothetical protein PIB30_072792 [Stylosanthes scabra]|uniref:Uncharacterized protein n=1 Tax=Stylosanthes scabra TaxID=79078 RepID=A0ABU6UN14_9FABA|nr:hypothetical protein [Stylosanthes scabra]
MFGGKNPDLSLHNRFPFSAHSQLLLFKRAVVAEESAPDSGGTHDSPHVTPSKGRTKVRARRTPTPTKVVVLKYLLHGEVSSHDVEVQEAVSAQHATTYEPVNRPPPNQPKSAVPSTNPAPITSDSFEAPSNELLAQYVPIPQVELPTQHQRLRTQLPGASRAACAANNGAHAPGSRKSPNLKARSGISSLWT